MRRISCFDQYFLTRVTFDNVVSFGTVGFSYRFDEGGIGYDDLLFANDGRSAAIFTQNLERAAKLFLSKQRFRLQLKWLGEPLGFFEFDLTGGQDALNNLGCGAKAVKTFNSISIGKLMRITIVR